MATLDTIVIVVFLGASLTFGLLFSRHATGSMGDFFLSGRRLPWWLAGISMAATNYSIDSPLATMKYVAQRGIAGLWIDWGGAMAVLLAAFFFSRLWRRAEVLTDAELIELRYSGKPAAALRLFKGLYFGVFLNCYVLGWVLKAVVKTMSGVADLPVLPVLLVTLSVALIYTLASGLTGVVWSDLVQWIVAQVGAVLLAVYAMREVGGIAGLMEGLDRRLGSADTVTRFLPALREAPVLQAEAGYQLQPMPLSAFFTFVLVQWWANKYSDGGGKHIQRMMACRSEGDAQAATVFLAIANYALQIWPFALVALASLVILGPLPDPEMGFPILMARLLPTGLLGLSVATMLGAFMSTVDTHLNLGAAYVINDLYRRFLRPEASPRHYVWASRLAMIGLMAVAAVVSFFVESIGDAYRFLLAFIGGAGLVWILRWFWWRVNAWSEIAAMLASGIATFAFKALDPQISFAALLPRVALASALLWIPVTLLTAPASDAVLKSFFTRVRSGSPGWRTVYARLGLTPTPYLGRAIVDWVGGLLLFFGINFGAGHLLLGRPLQGVSMLALGALSGAWLWRRLRGRARPI